MPTANVAFVGRSIDLIGPLGSAYGKASVSLDGGAPTTLDLYSSTFQAKQQLFSSGPIAEGPHTLQVTVLGSKNASSTGTYVWVDAFDIVGEIGAADTTAPVTSSSTTTGLARLRSGVASLTVPPVR